MSAQPQLTPRAQAASRLGASVVPFRPVPFVEAPDVSVPPRPTSANVTPLSQTWTQRPEAPPAAVADVSSPAASPKGLFANIYDVVVGLGLLAADAVPELFKPIAFFTKNARTLAMAAVYLAVPLITTIAIYLLVPGMVSAFPINAATGWLYLAALFVATGISACLFLAGLRGIGAGVQSLISAAQRRAHN